MSFLKVSCDKVYDGEPEDLLKELDDRLPRAFWTQREWVQYTIERSKLLNLIRMKEDLRKLLDNECYDCTVN